MSDSGSLPLTPYQLDMWAAESQAPGSPQFVTVVSQRFAGSMDLELLRQCVMRALERHDTFRLRFGEREGIPLQWLADHPGAEPGESFVRILDFSRENDPAAACRAWRENTKAIPFEVFDRPLFEASVLREGDSVQYLHIKCHHLLIDGWAVDRLRNEILRDYVRRSRGEQPPALGPAPSVLAVARERAAYFSSPEYEKDRAFHRAALSGLEPAFFPRRRPAAAAQPQPQPQAPAPGEPEVPGGPEAPGRPGCGRYPLTVEARLVERIKKQGGSPFAFLLAVLGVYLARVHRTDHAVVGVPLLNRRTKAELAVVGSYATTHALRIDVPDGKTFADIVADVRAAVGELQEHQRLPAGEVLRDLAAVTGTTERRLFDVTFSYQPLKQLAEPDGVDVAPARHFAPPHDREALAIHLMVFPGAQDLTIDLNYALDAFDEDLPIASVAGHLAELIRQGIEHPERPARELEVLTAAEQEALSRLTRGPRVPYAAEKTLHGLFEERAARVPDRPAVYAADGSVIGYAELDARADRIARALRAHGVGPDDRVAVLMERGPRQLAAVLGVLKAGGAYVPVDPGYPEQRIAYMLADSGAKAVLVDPDADVPATDAPVLRVDDLPDGPDAPDGPDGPGAPLEPAGDGRSLAYVIYTSGSTGQPKGVMVEHHSVVNRLAWMQRAYPIGPDDVLLQKTPASFDVSVWELFWWGIEGARVALLPPGGEKDPREILRSIAARNVSVLHFVPSMLGPFLDLLEEDPGLRGGARSLRLVFCSGEALPPARVEQFHRVFGEDGAPVLVNLYGPTEATVDVSAYECPGAAAGPVARVPIGRPIDNTDLYVLAPDGSPQPVGVPGELWIGGVGLARGYLGRPELTWEKFRAEPSVPGGRLYRTGDLARRLADGNLEYLGRIDDQVKIRGNRVELGEVQDALSRLPGVREAVVVARTRPDGGSYLAGYYVPGDPAPDPAALRERLAGVLPNFMIPSRLVPLDRIPLTPNGKADRKRLPDPEAGPERPEEDRSPRTGTEAALAEIWAEVLGTGPVSVHDDYYALGGDSILMLRIRALAERRGIHFALDDLVWHPTVAGLATRATTAAGTGTGTAPGTGTAAGTDTEPAPFDLVSRVDRARLEGAVDAFPLTRLQLGLVYHSRQYEDSAVYRDVFRYRLAMAWDEDRFRRAFDRLAARHPALRSTFDLGGCTEPMQVVHPGTTGGLEVVDLRGRRPEEADAAICGHIEQRRFHRYRFEREQPYLFRAHVRENAVDLVLSFHHALLDGGSVAGLLSELLQDYLHSAGADIGPVPPGPHPSPAHHVRAERAALADRAARDHWAGVLAGTEPLRLDGFAPAEPPRGDGAVTHHTVLPAELADQVRAFSRRHAVPVKSVLFAAYCQSLQVFSSLDGTLVTGLITHGRPERDGADRMSGLFLNTVPVRLDDRRRPDPGSRLDAVRALFHQERAAHAHRHYPLSAMQEDRGGAPVLHTAFNYVHFHVLSEVLKLPEVRLESFLTWEETNFQLLVNAFVDPVDGRVGLRVDGDGRTFTPAQAELFTRTYADVLQRVVTHPDEAPGHDFLPAAPSRAVHGGGPAADVVELFGRRAAETPDAVAVSAGSGTERRQWTYRELDEATDRVARRLLAAGARPGARIGIAMDRSPEAIAVILGVAKAGAAAVPLDSGYPKARLAAMLEQARPFRVVAERSHAGLVTEPGLLLPAESLLSVPRSASDEAATASDEAATASDEAATTADEAATAGLPGSRDPDRLAYLLFTSGSTGRPKGVAMPHRSLANLVDWQTRQSSGAVGGVTAQYAPLSFDVSFQEIYSTLCSGGTLRVVSESERRDMAALLRLLDEDGVERIFLPYVALQQLAEASVAHGPAPRRLRVVVSSGEQLRVTDAIRRFLGSLPGALLENQYGPTESHVVTSHTMTGDPAGFPALAPIGRPIDGAEVRVLDGRGRPVPVGVQGEIHISGVCLADGYFGDPDLTAERFVPLPPGTGTTRRVAYRTGDLGFVLPDGAIVCTGRSDAQVKVRGYRVEPAETELAIGRAASRHPAVDITEAAVVARRQAAGEVSLVAFLVGSAERTDLRRLREELHTALPSYLVPTHFEWLPRLPLTPSGKRDDRALRTMPLTRSAPRNATAPRDALERSLTAMIGELLGVDGAGVGGAGVDGVGVGVGIDDSIFELGATSITTMRLVVLIEQRYGVTVPISAFVAAPTAAALAELLRSGGGTARFDPLVPIRPGGTGRPLFLVHPMGGNVLCYVPFARHLPEDQPLYAFQAAGGDAGTTPLDSVPDLAAGYLAAMRRVQPEGPYALGGWSFGGFVAFEMARQLRAAGEEVGTVVLLDTVALGPDARRAAYTDDALLGWFFWELLLLGRGGDSERVDFPEELATLEEKFAFIARYAADLGVLPADSNGALVRRLFAMYAAHWRSTVAYQPEAASFDVTVLRATEPLPQVLMPMHSTAGSRHQDPANGWHSMTTGAVDVIAVPGDHLTLMEEPHVREVAGIVAALARTGTADHRPPRPVPPGPAVPGTAMPGPVPLGPVASDPVPSSRFAPEGE
ncbi:amino acid adenylation domain-containing protein [Kitasatospora sp. NPDC056446]|uniref:amino acid adenylation domain-containing protein n=1 Tax=Kitasatospora sp. NPDC056446 TaxID=3345819 RepID=UPI003690EE32